MAATLSRLHGMADGGYLYEALHDNLLLLKDLLYPIHELMALCTKAQLQRCAGSALRKDGGTALESQEGPWQKFVVSVQEQADAFQAFAAKQGAAPQAEAARLQAEVSRQAEEARHAQEEAAEQASAGQLQANRIQVKLADISDAIEAVLAAGKTPLVIDSSEQHNVDTFLSYGKFMHCMALSGKKMVVEKTQKKRPVAEILEEARVQVVACMKQGRPLVIMCENAVPDFATTLNDESAQLPAQGQTGRPESSFPSALFYAAGATVCQEPWPQHLFRDDDLEAGLAVPRDGFSVLVTTRFKVQDFEEYLFGNKYGLPKPKEMYQAIEVTDEPTAEHTTDVILAQLRA